MTSFYRGGGWGEEGLTRANCMTGQSSPAESAAVTLQVRNHTHTDRHEMTVSYMFCSVLTHFSREETERTRRDY